MLVYLGYFSTYLSLLPLIISLKHYRKIPREILSLFVLLVVSVFTDFLNVIVSQTYGNNVSIIHFFTVIEFILIVFFYKHFFDQFRKVSIHYWLIGIFIVIAATEAITNGLHLMNNISSSVEFLILIIYAALAFFFTMKNLIYENIIAEPFFWINTAILIYFAGNLFLFLFSKYLQVNNPSYYEALYSIHSIAYIIYCVLISIGFWKLQKK